MPKIFLSGGKWFMRTPDGEKKPMKILEDGRWAILFGTIHTGFHWYDFRAWPRLWAFSQATALEVIEWT